MPPVRTVLVVAATLACADGRSGAPDAEFLLAAGDSTYWVRSSRANQHMRGSPIFLTSIDGRLREVYAADEDHSYYDAVIVGIRAYSRDILTGDSVLVFQDSVIGRVAAAYARAHPRARRLAPKEEAAEQPSTFATAELDFLDVHGPYLSWEYHADIQVSGELERHVSRRGVLDLRDGRRMTLAALFGDTLAREIVAQGRRVLDATLDSLITSDEEQTNHFLGTLSGFVLDPASFVLTNIGDQPAVAFLVPGRESAQGFTLPLDPITVPPPGWWSTVVNTLPAAAESEDAHLWTRPDYSVVVRYGGGEDHGVLALVGEGGRQWPMGKVAAPALRIFWLDDPPMDSLARAALSRAFDEASLYSEESRVAALTIVSEDRVR